MSNDGIEGHRWFNVRTLRTELNELENIIKSKIKHSYVEKYIQKPFIDSDKICILNYLYNHLQMPIKRKQQYITTIMLVQIALDTHELIPSNNHHVRTMSETEKQLSVLAGDYYSGLYYLLLSEIEDLKMIHVLAEAIENINEQKMKLFCGNPETVEDLFLTIQNIESLLFTEVATFINADETIIPMIIELLMINRLYKEKDQIIQQQFSYIDNFMKNMATDNSYSVIHMIDDEIDRRKQKLDQLLIQLPYHFIVLKNIIRNKVKLTYNASLAEEG